MRKQIVAGLVGLCLSGLVQACALDLGLRGGFDIGREGALIMAVAIGQARADGLIETPDLQDDQALAQMRARLWQMKLKTYKGEKPTFYFYQNLDKHWSEISTFVGNTQIGLHRPPRPEMEDGVVVMSHGDVTDALMNDKLTLTEAEEKDLIKITGPAADVMLVKAWINNALNNKSNPFGL